MKKKNVVIAGGGTGGHIYPGLAISEYLKVNHPDLEVHFVGATGGLEESIVPRSGHQLHLLRVERLHHSVGRLRRLKSLALLPFSFIQSIYLYFKLRPVWVLGVGGFASGPFVFMSSLLGGRTAILEPNAYPGLANRLLARWVRFCFVVFQEAGAQFPKSKVKAVGLPVRIPKKNPEFTYDGQRPFRILIFGGSQGSRAINSVVADWVESLGENSSNFEILHQIGARDFTKGAERYGDKYQSFLTYTDYIHDMPRQLDWADLVICRSGIGSVAEVAMSGKPALFIPLPSAADNHQVKNAKVLCEQSAAFMLEEKDLKVNTLGARINELRSNPKTLKKTMECLKSIDYSDAQKQIVSSLMGGENGN